MNPASYETIQNNSLTITLSARTGVNEDLTFDIVVPPVHGQLSSIDNTGFTTALVEYTPEAAFSGDDGFLVSVRNGQGDSATAPIALKVYPQVFFSLDTLSGPSPLTVFAQVFTLTNEPLPAGTYAWTFGAMAETGSEDTHNVRTHVFTNPGFFNVTLSLTLASGFGPISCINSNTNTNTARVSVNPVMSGYVRTSSGAGVSGVSMVEAPIGTNSGSTAITDGNGFYTVTVPYGWSGIVTPQHVDYSFSPASLPYTDVTGMLSNQDYVATSVGIDNCPNDPNKTDPGACGCGVPDTDSDGDGTPDCVDNCPNDPGKTDPGVCGCGVSDADSNGNGTPDCNDVPAGCTVSSSTWQNFSIAPQSGTFTVEFDAIPNGANIDALTGLSAGQGATFSDFAVLVRFNQSGTIDARNGGGYAADTPISYTMGESYHFRVVINVSAHTYTTHVTPQGAAEQAIATDFAFRSEQSNVTNLDNWGLWGGTGSHQVCNLALLTCQVDSDGDGTNDCEDGCPDDPNKTAPGICGCGMAESLDSDGDGVLDCVDQCPGGPDGDSDGDGVADCIDQCPGAPDVDSDGDGVLDCNDGCPNDNNKTAPGLCGCGVSDVDSDGDGTPDCNDGCPSDPNKTDPGLCGCNRSDQDLNGNGTPDGCEGQTASSITNNNITWTFDHAYQVGQFANGDWWILDEGSGVTILSVSPAPTGSGSSFRHGSVVNPVGGASQGYDGRINGYDAALSKSFPLVLAGGESLVSTQSITNEEDCGTSRNLDVTGYCVLAGHSYLYRAAVLTVLSGMPSPDAFRPPYAGTAKPMYLTTNLRRDLLPSLPLNSKPSLSFLNDVANQFQQVWLDHKPGWNARMMHPVKNMPNYGREVSLAVSEAAVLLMLDYSEQELDPLLINFVQVGIDLYAMVENGASWPADGGHSSGRKWPIIFSGIMLDNANMKSVTGAFGEEQHTYYGNAASNNPGQSAIALFGRSCVSPYQANGCSGSGAKDCRDPAGIIDACTVYRNCCTSHTWVGACLAARIMNAKSLWNHDAFFDYVDRWMGYGLDAQVVGGGGTGTAFIQDMWDTYRSVYP